MAIAPICDICQLELSDYGAILLSPPDSKDMVRKDHICKGCYQKLNEMITKRTN